MADSFICYRSFMDALSDLPAEDFKTAMLALSQYACDGIAPDLDELSPVARVFLKMAAPQIDANAKRREDGQKGAEFGKLGGRPKKARNSQNENPENPRGVMCETPNVNVNVNDNVNENVNDNVCVSIDTVQHVDTTGATHTRGFTPPTHTQISVYAKSINKKIDAQRFIDHYSAKGWMIGKTVMQDWKAAVRLWEDPAQASRASPRKPSKTVSAHNYEQRTYAESDFDDLFCDLKGG